MGRKHPCNDLLCPLPCRFNDEVKHIKVVEKDNWIHITEAKKFESLLVWYSGKNKSCLEPDLPGGFKGLIGFDLLLQELVEYYQGHSLKESFKQLDTTLKYPYKSRERSASRTLARSPGKGCLHPAGGHRAGGELAQGAPPLLPQAKGPIPTSWPAEKPRSGKTLAMEMGLPGPPTFQSLPQCPMAFHPEQPPLWLSPAGQMGSV